MSERGSGVQINGFTQIQHQAVGPAEQGGGVQHVQHFQIVQTGSAQGLDMRCAQASRVTIYLRVT